MGARQRVVVIEKDGTRRWLGPADVFGRRALVDVAEAETWPDDGSVGTVLFDYRRSRAWAVRQAYTEDVPEG